jgi:hypothetical protein
MIEAQASYVIDCLDLMRRRNTDLIEVRPEAQEEYNRRLQERMLGTVFVTGCKNWYRGKDGGNPILWPSYSFWYWMRSRRVAAEAFR